MKYIVDLPKEYISGSSLFGEILSIPIQINGDKNYNIPTSIKITPYTEPDEDKSYGINRYKVIGLAFLKWLGNDVGDKLKSADDVYRFLDKNCYNKDAVEQGVWEFAGEFYNADREVETLFGCDLNDICKKYTYSEAKAKYEAWLKQKDEIHVGDEVIYEEGGEPLVVLRLYQPRMYKSLFDGIFPDGDIEQQLIVENYRKTGRHFPQVEELLKKIGEREEGE